MMLYLTVASFWVHNHIPREYLVKKSEKFLLAVQELQ